MKNVRARIELNIYQACGTTPDYRVDVSIENTGRNHYIATILRPVDVAAVSAKPFYDNPDTSKKGTVLNLADVVNLRDWRGGVAKPETNRFNFVPDNYNYFGYYGVTNIVPDVENILTVGMDKDKPDEIKPINKTSVKVTHDPGKNAGQGRPTFDGKTAIENQKKLNDWLGTLTYENILSNVHADFKLILPVEIAYQWGKISANVTIPVIKTEELTNGK